MNAQEKTGNKAEQAALKQQYLDIIKQEVWQDQKMIDFCAGKVAYIVKLCNGDILPIEKPSIKKDFCFGYSDSRYDTEDYDRAQDMAAHAKKNEDYFMRENMEDINRSISILDGTEHSRYRHTLRVPYTGQPQTSRLKHLEMFDPYADDDRQEISAEDRALILAGYHAARGDFEKRLRQYLKRYGMSKVNSWAYWRDE